MSYEQLICSLKNDALNEPLGAKGPPLVGEESARTTLAKLEVDKFQPSHRVTE
jgi:hypothetical protein